MLKLTSFISKFYKRSVIVFVYVFVAGNLFLTEVNAQLTSVSGVVQDESGNTLPGVSVVIRGTSQGTTTDFEGRFNLDNVPGNGILVFSSVGFVAKEISAASLPNILILERDISNLGEIVVIGFGSQKKSDVVGSIASANLEAFKEAPNVNIMQSLQGSVPGLNVGQVNSAGQSPSFSIRGQTTISGSKSPLIVLDGVIFEGNLSLLNPEDIASVDILKDVSSKAIYGSQAANGVILITTKRGISRNGKPTISYSGTITTQSPTIKNRPLNAAQYVEKINDIEYKSAYLPPDYTEPNPEWNYTLSQLLQPMRNGIEAGNDFDWWGQFTRHSYIMDHQISISNNLENTRYYISAGYNDDRGVIKNDNFKRVNARINLETDIKKWLTVGTNTFGSFVDGSGAHPSISRIVQSSPTVLPWDQDGELLVQPFGTTTLNPFLTMASDDNNTENIISSNLFANIKVPWIPGLSYRLNFNNSLNWNQHFFSSIYEAGQTGQAYKNHGSQKDVTIDNIVSYNQSFGQHNLDLTFVAGQKRAKSETTNSMVTDFADLTLSYNNLSQGTIPSASSSAWEENSLYQLFRTNYNFKNKYFLSGTIRRDGFSGFAENNKIAWFPSAGLSWIISREDFFQVNAINFLKFRLSYGQNGNQTSRYSSLPVVSRSSSLQYVFGDGGSTVLGQSVSTLGNNDLTWEKTSGFNAGLDVGLIDDRIGFNLDVYTTKTKALLWDLSLPDLSGFSSIRSNLGQINNFGIEFSVNATPVRTSAFEWDINVNFSHNSNRITELIGKEDLIADKLFINQPIGTIYDFKVEGIYQLSDRDIMSGFSPGTYRLKDLNGDTKITAADDRMILGHTEPAYELGILNSFKYRNFTLRFFIHSIQGGKNGYLRANSLFTSNTSGNATQANWMDFTIADLWSPRNPNGQFSPQWITAQQKPDRYLQRNFVRLQDVSLSYNFGNELIDKLGLNNLKLFVSGKNLLTLTDWKGWDPETGQGMQLVEAFPVLKSITLGLNVSF